VSAFAVKAQAVTIRMRAPEGFAAGALRAIRIKERGGGESMYPSARRLAFVLLVSIGATPLPGWSADNYPARPIRFVVGPGPNSGTDIIARMIALKLGERLGQSVIVENRTGAGGTLAAAAVAKAPPDGYVMHFASGALAVHPALYRELPYDVARDFAPVALIGIVPQVLVVHPSLPAKNLRELLALAKRRPGEINMGSGGLGSTNHLAGELLQSMAGVRFTHIPYKGAGPAAVDLIAGQIQILFTGTVNALQHSRQGRVRALAVSTAKRSSAVPDLPTVSEAGVPGYQSMSWYGLVAPAGTPREIVARMNREVAAVVGLPEVQSKFQADGVQPEPGTPDQFAQMIREEMTRVAQIVKSANIQAR
jgi:tripartite-type tricarboxylate transporter receptor subunit TctC